MTGLTSLVCSVIFGLSAAAFTPGGTQFAGWGELVDETGMARAAVNADGLTLKTPGTYLDLWPKDGLVNSPLVLRDAEGDFSIRVRIDPTRLTTSAKVAAAKNSPAFRAGSLVIWLDKSNFIRFDRATSRSETNGRTYAYFHVFDNDERVTQAQHALPDTPTWLSLVRRSDQVEAYFWEASTNKWTFVASAKVKLPRQLRVGIATINTAPTECSVTFSNHQLEHSSER